MKCGVGAISDGTLAHCCRFVSSSHNFGHPAPAETLIEKMTFTKLYSNHSDTPIQMCLRLNVAVERDRERERSILHEKDLKRNIKLQNIIDQQKKKKLQNVITVHPCDHNINLNGSKRSWSIIFLPKKKNDKLFTSRHVN